MAADDLRDSVPADLDIRMAAFLSNHVPVSWTHCSCGEPFPAQRHNLHVGHELAEAVRMFTTPLVEELDRLTAELAQHVACAVCGHERYQHERDPILQAMWCRACTTLDDLHDFTPTTEETPS